MSDRSQYLDSLIEEINSTSEETEEKKTKYIASHIEGFDKSWKRKLFLENYYLPALVVYTIVIQMLFFKFENYIFTIVPLGSILVLMLLQIKTNLKSNEIDLGLDVINYGKKQLAVVRDQLFIFKWFRRIIYPAIFISIIAELIYSSLYNQELWVFITITLKLAGMGGVFYFERKSVRELSAQEKNFNY